MTRRKHLDQRRAINAEIAARDARARCSFCKREMCEPHAGLVTLGSGTLEFCDGDCLRDYEDAQKALEAKR